MNGMRLWEIRTQPKLGGVLDYWPYEDAPVKRKRKADRSSRLSSEYCCCVGGMRLSTDRIV